MTAVRAGDVISALQGLADSNCDRLLADIEMRQTRHQGARVEIVDLSLKRADGDHLAVHAKPSVLTFAASLSGSATAVISQLQTCVPVHRTLPRNPASPIPFRAPQ